MSNDRSQAPRSRVQTAVLRLVPGLVLVALLAVPARLSTLAMPAFIGEVTVGLVLGVVVANTVTLPRRFVPGTQFALSTLLRLGIVLLGVRMSVGDVLDIGAIVAGLIVFASMTAFAVAIGLGRFTHIPPRLALLIGVGTAICGNTAIIAAAPVIEAEEREVSFAVGTITLFGMLAVIVYPLIGHLFGMTDRFFGSWAGMAINDTSQVTAAGFAYTSSAGEIATVVKLARNLLIGPALVLLGFWYRRSNIQGDDRQAGHVGGGWLLRVVPPFVLAFVVVVVVNSVGIVPGVLVAPITEVSKLAILLALVGVGLNTRLSGLRHVGLRPIAVGFAAAILLSLLAFILLSQVTRMG